MSKPTIVCIPGAWHTAEVFTKTFQHLNKHGYTTIGLTLPSVGTLKTFEDDVKSVRDCLTRLIDEEGKDVILVTHSVSGLQGCEATAGLGKKEREAKGLKGGVVRMVFINAFALSEGFSCTAGAGGKAADWISIDEAKGICTVSRENAKKVFYNDISWEEADPWIEKLQPHSYAIFDGTLTYAAWRHIPSTYVRSLKDMDKTDFSTGFVDYMIKTAQEQNPQAFDVIEGCDGGHCLMVSHADWLADVLRRAAGENV